MNGKQFTAIELLMSYPDYVVAEMLGVRLTTLLRWMSGAEFTRALKARERDQMRGLARIARSTALRAAVALCQTAGEPSKSDAKILLDLLKTSGAFETEEDNSDKALAEIVRQVKEEVSEDDE